MHKYEIVAAPYSLLGESPVWDSASGSIIWVDILGHCIYRFYPETNVSQTHQACQMVSAVAVKRSGGLIAVFEHGFAEIDLADTRSVREIADPEVHLPGNRFNDGKCDPRGRFWAGTMSMKGEPGAGNLYMLNHDLSVSLKESNISCSNGMDWSPDHLVFYYIDTPTRRVAAYDYDIVTGYIKNKRNVIEIPGNNGQPDGMTIDADGMLWIALWDGWGVERWNPHTGDLLYRIELPVARATSCTFGGERLSDLYITSAQTGLSASEKEAQPNAGALFVVKDCGFRGRPANQFG